jgi:hypothetical protein
LGGRSSAPVGASPFQPQPSVSQHETTVDGRDFFRRAKSILSYDDFTHLLWNVKAYNNREQSRAQTLEKVGTLFGQKQPDVYREFERLLNR